MDLLPPGLLLRAWQKDFCDSYLADPVARSLVVAPAGSGKTVSALYLAKQLMRSQVVDAALVMTDRQALADQWLHASREFGIDARSDDVGVIRGASTVVTTHWLQHAQHRADVAAAVRDRRWFVIVDESGPFRSAVTALANFFVAINEESRVVVLTRRLPDRARQGGYDREFVIGPRIIQPATAAEIARYSPSFSLLRRLHADRGQLDRLSWRQFEKLVAELLEADGYTVELTRGSKDGGVDVIAFKDGGPAGLFKTVWQAKKLSGSHKVGLATIRELADTTREHGASKGMIVTTTWLTRDALARVERDKYTLGKVERGELDGWIQRKLTA